MGAANMILMGIQIATAAAKLVPEAVDAAAAVQRMVDEGRDPTPEEWAHLTAVTDALRGRLKDAAGGA